VLVTGMVLIVFSSLHDRSCFIDAFDSNQLYPWLHECFNRRYQYESTNISSYMKIFFFLSIRVAIPSYLVFYTLWISII